MWKDPVDEGNLCNRCVPEWIPMRSLSWSRGRCRILKDRTALSSDMAILAISRACCVPLRTGNPDTTMYASPIVSTCISTCHKINNNVTLLLCAIEKAQDTTCRPTVTLKKTAHWQIPCIFIVFLLLSKIIPNIPVPDICSADVWHVYTDCAGWQNNYNQKFRIAAICYSHIR